MLRERFTEALKEAMRAKNQRTVSTVRMILAGLKDRDIAARSRGVTDGVPDNEVVNLLKSMIKQRQESVKLYEQGGRADLVQQESEEIAIIEGFLPKQFDDAEAEAAIRAVIAELGATSIKDMGKVMAELRSRFGDRMDFAKASPKVKAALG